MKLKFTKMHGLGNDFVVFDAINQQVELSVEQLTLLADRHFGVGCDQILLVEKPRTEDTEFYYRIFNADGSEVEQCGNGARCFATFVHDQQLTDHDIIDVGTAGGNIRLQIQSDGQVKVNMGAPILNPADIPFIAEQQSSTYTINSNGQELTLGAVSMGNPHGVIIVDDVKTAPVDTLGPMVEQDAHFPNQANIGFMAVNSRTEIDLRVFERGSGETLACGTGACAAVVSGQLRGLLDETVKVSLPGGQLMISWAGDNNPVWMTGPTASVFEAQIEL